MLGKEQVSLYSGCQSFSTVWEYTALPTTLRLTAEGQQAGVGDRGLAQVQHLEHGEVFRQEPQAGVSKLWAETLSAHPRTPGWGRAGGGVVGAGAALCPSRESDVCLSWFRSSFCWGLGTGAR